jgi:hypothetical protein
MLNEGTAECSYLLLKAWVPSACRPFCLPVLTLLGFLPSICSQSPCLCSPAAKGKSNLKALTSRSSGPCAQWHLSPIAHPPSSCSSSIGDHLVGELVRDGGGGGGEGQRCSFGDISLHVHAHSVCAWSSMHLAMIPLLRWHLLSIAHPPSSCNTSMSD